MSQPLPQQYVDSVLVAFARKAEDERMRARGRVFTHCDGAGRIERWETPTGHHSRRYRRRRPGVRVGDRRYRSPLDVHQPDETTLPIVQSAYQHGRAAVLRLDLALDFLRDTFDAADAAHEWLRHNAFLPGARGRSASATRPP